MKETEVISWTQRTSLVVLCHCAIYYKFTKHSVFFILITIENRRGSCINTRSKRDGEKSVVGCCRCRVRLKFKWNFWKKRFVYVGMLSVVICKRRFFALNGIFKITTNRKSLSTIWYTVK